MKLKDYDFRNYLSYETSHDFDEDGERQYPQIESYEFDASDLYYMAEDLLKFLKENYKNFHFSSNDKIDIYLIHRILIKTKIYDIDYNVETTTMDDWYGEVLVHAKFSENYCLEIEQKLIELFSFKKDYEKFNYAFKMEYGRLLPCLKEPYSIKIENFPGFDNIIYKKKRFIDVSAELPYYRIYQPENPLGILFNKPGACLHLLDGFHRLINNQDKAKTVFVLKTIKEK